MLKKYLKELVQLPGVSSREEKVIEYVYHHFKKHSEDVQIDALGNVILKITSGKETAKKMMIFAHMDEIGFIIRKVEKNGFLRIERIGGVSTQILPGLIIDIQGEKGIVKGIIGTPAHHFIRAEDKFSVPQVNELYVDIGAVSEEQVKEMGINVGTFATFEPRYEEMANEVICGKALDNRGALAVLLEFLEESQGKSFGWDIYIVAAVMEEFNIRGIIPAVHMIQPDAMLGIDITPSCDTPDMDYNDVVLGKGPAITYMNFHGGGTLAGVLPDKTMLAFLEKACKEAGITWQREIAPGVITENAFALWENGGIPVCSLSIPTRYTHTPVECVHYSDLEALVKTIQSFVTGLKEDTCFGKRYGYEYPDHNKEIRLDN